LVRLTAERERFDGLHWSPDGQWLLTAWQQPADQSGSALYLLSADGRQGRLFTSVPDTYVSPVGWHPDGSRVVYHRWDGNSPGAVWMVEVETGTTVQLPGYPIWSPTGERVVYFEAASESPTGSIWRADSETASARLIAERVLPARPAAHWSPDGGRLAFTVLNEKLDESSIVVYDLDSGRLVPFLTPSDLMSRLLAPGAYSATEATLAGIPDREPPEVLLPLGWSADGQQLIVSARWVHSPEQAGSRAILAVVPGTTNGPFTAASGQTQAAHPLAFAAEGSLNGASWSPADPDRLVYPGTCREPACQVSWAYILDQANGTVPIYELPVVEETRWPPDGAWVVFMGGGEVVIVDREGQNRWAPKRAGSCFELAWNPAFDGSGLTQASAIKRKVTDR
jgi:dipeptidyl aminopeptidase/acylaminoacyl peptidase